MKTPRVIARSVVRDEAISNSYFGDCFASLLRNFSLSLRGVVCRSNLQFVLWGLLRFATQKLASLATTARG
jgi:hypothetical protein